MNSELHDIAMLALSKASISLSDPVFLAENLYDKYNKIMNVLEDLEERNNTPTQGLSFNLRLHSGHTIEEAIEEVKRVLPPESDIIIHSDKGAGCYNVQINPSSQLTLKQTNRIIGSELRYFKQV